jgi:hypothetical protein
MLPPHKTSPQAPKIIRVSNDAMIPLEIWDAYVKDDDILWDHMYKEHFSEYLAKVLCQLQIGQFSSPSQIPLAAEVEGFDRVFITGGGALTSNLIKNLTDQISQVYSNQSIDSASIPFIIECASDPRFAAIEAGKVLLSTLGEKGGAVIDIGQTSIKTSTHQYFDRDFTAVKMNDNPEVTAVERDTALQAFYSFSNQAIASTMAAKNNIHNDVMVLALPCEISANGRLNGCSYIGFENNETLVSSLFDNLTTPPKRVYLLNDAELSAYAATVQNAEAGTIRKTLVITLGFGVGACLVLHESGCWK